MKKVYLFKKKKDLIEVVFVIYLDCLSNGDNG